MKTKFNIRHKGIPVTITQERDHRFVLSEYTTGKRVRHVRTTYEEARDKALEICELMASGQTGLIALSPYESEIRASMAALPPGMRLGRAVDIVRECCELVAPEEIVAACRYWRDHPPVKKLIPTKIKDASADYMARREKKITHRRMRADRCYMGIFVAKFGNRLMTDLTTREIKDWADDRGWAAKTKVDAFGLVQRLYADSIERGFATDNPAKIKREKIRVGDVGIFTPAQTHVVMLAVLDRLKPFFALWFFSGLRKEEASRLSILQVREGLASGSIFLPAHMAKTGRSRSVFIADNLRAWLMRYLPLDGMLLPPSWQGHRRLDELVTHAATKSKLKWVPNGPRHSFGTYHLKLHGDPAETVRQMGNSLQQLDRHYNSRAHTVTKESAREYFNILPRDQDNIVPMDPSNTGAFPKGNSAVGPEIITSRTGNE